MHLFLVAYQLALNQCPFFLDIGFMVPCPKPTRQNTHCHQVEIGKFTKVTEVSLNAAVGHASGCSCALTVYIKGNIPERIHLL